jgi:uncharacterized membrane protein YgdD (TMEM256/DUF423 family)
MNVNKKNTVIAAILGALTIAIGAFGAHGLKEIVSEKTITSFEIGVRYQMYHVIVLIIQKTQKWASRFFIFGIFLFSGSIYLITLKEFFSFNTKIFTILTPIGGLFLITGWLRLAYGIIVNK